MGVASDMKTIQVTIDEPLLTRLDNAAAHEQVARSALIRKAVQRFLADQAQRALDHADEEAYRKDPVDLDELRAWEKVQAWEDDDWSDV